MAIDYMLYKKLTSTGIVDGSLSEDNIGDSQAINSKFAANTIQAGNIAPDTITSTQLSNNSISIEKLADNSIDMASASISGVLDKTHGGTGLSTLGNYSDALRVKSDGSGYEWGRKDISAIKVYTSNTTWTKPANVAYVRVMVVGGGGGGSGHGEAGGAGGYAEEIINVASISSVSITVGGNGGGNTYHNYGGNGGTTSFGPYLSASGGEGARRVGGHSGGRGGVGSGGNFNVWGGGGAGHCNHGGGEGGGSYFGGSNIGVHDSGPQPSNQETRASQGSGGTGAPRGRRRGASGRPGMCIVYEYQ